MRSCSWPSSRASSVPSRCSRRRCGRRPRDPSSSRRSTAGWRGRRVSARATCTRSSTRAPRSSSPTALDDDRLRARAGVVRAILGWIVGDGATPELPLPADDLATALGGERLVQEATFAVVGILVSSLRWDEARSLLERECREWQDRDEPRSARALWGLAWVEFWAGDWDRAAEHAERAHEISIQYGLEVPQDHLPIALVAVHRGQLDLARQHSERALALADEQFGLQPPQHLAILGLVAWGRGDAPGAAAWLDRADRAAAALGWGEPSIRWWSADLVEVLLDLGRIDDAVRVLDRWEADATRLGREGVLAHVSRCRGLVAAAQGDLELARGRARACGRRAHDGRRPVRPRAGTARAGRRQTSQPSETRRARRDRGRRRRVRGARRRRLGGEGPRRARAHRRPQDRTGTR